MSEQFHFNLFSSTLVQFISIWSINRSLSDFTTLGQSAPGSDINEEVFDIPLSSRITETASSDCLVSYQDIRWRVSYPSAEKQLMYFTSKKADQFTNYK